MLEELKDGMLNAVIIRKQHPINQFIDNFRGNQQILVIEVNGSVHELEKQKDRNEQPQAILNELY